MAAKVRTLHRQEDKTRIVVVATLPDSAQRPSAAAQDRISRPLVQRVLMAKMLIITQRSGVVTGWLILETRVGDGCSIPGRGAR